MIVLSWTAIYGRLLPTEYSNAVSDSVFYRTIQIEFPISNCEVDTTYSDNGANLRELHQLLQEVQADNLLQLDTLKVFGYASPDGSLLKNRELSLRRATALYTYLKNKCQVEDSLMTFGENIVPWSLFRDIISQSDYSWRADALKLLSEGDDNNAVDNTHRINRLKHLAGGEAWRVVKSDVFPKLRRALVVSAIMRKKSSPAEENTEVEEYLEQVDTTGFHSCDTTLLQESELRISISERDYDRFAIKSNAAYLCAGVSNIGAEYAFHPHWSVDLPLVYSPYTIARSYRMKFLYVQPELRYWTSRALRGHFIGVHVHGGVFNVSVDRKNRYQSEKGFHGAGISYGYSLPVSRRWSIEFTVGVGYTFTKYSTYYNVYNGMKYQNDIPYNYWGIDKLGLNVVYRFGDKSGKRKEVKP